MALAQLVAAKPTTAELTQEFHQRLGIRVETDDAAVRERCHADWIPANEDHVRYFLSTVETELARYPRPVLARAPFERLLLTRNITMHDRDWGGLARVEERTIVLGVGCPCPTCRAAARQTLHHEVFHMLDVAISGRSWSASSWRDLNAADFSYFGYDGWPSSPADGFVRGYSMAHESEDRADVFAELMVNGASFAPRVAADPILRAKVDWLVRAVHGQYPELDEELRRSLPRR
jgi:hypothetical protein